MNEETELQSRIRIALSKYGAVVRMNTGTFYQGKPEKHPVTHQMILTNLRPVKCGIDGLPDLMVIGHDGVVSFIEVKMPNGKVRADQKHFIEYLKARNVNCGVARSVEEAIGIVKGDMNDNNGS